ncbi:MAG: carboxypeptidase-like regulatory domain-containing protein [Ferruginibacter sp.]
MRQLLLAVTLICSSFVVFAQQSITVKVTDSKTGNPVTSASVVIKSSGKGASTNNDGVFTIQAKANDILEITSIGYKPIMITVSNQILISVTLEPASVDLGDIVIVGSRTGGRAKTETAVPVDVIKLNQVGLPTAKNGLYLYFKYGSTIF